MSANNEAAILLGAGKVAFVNGAPTFTWQSGMFANAITDTGVGDSLITIDPDFLVAAADRTVDLQAVGGAGNTNMQYVETAVNQIQVLGFVAAVATDIAFNLWVWGRKFN